MKRLYRDAAVTEIDGGFVVALDGRAVRTPGKRRLVLPARPLAEAIAAEWQSQGDEVRPAEMPLTRLANTAIDRVVERRDEVIAEIARFATADLVCYRADDPPELAQLQGRGWQPLVDWAAERFGAALAVTSGLLPVSQPPEALAPLGEAVADFDDFALTALHAAAAACGSVVIGLALAHGRLDADAAWTLSLVDESFQIEKWGEDADAADRRAGLKGDIAAADAFLRLCRGSR